MLLTDAHWKQIISMQCLKKNTQIVNYKINGNDAIVSHMNDSIQSKSIWQDPLEGDCNVWLPTNYFY